LRWTLEALGVVAFVIYGLTFGHRPQAENVAVQLPGLTQEVRVVFLSDPHRSWYFAASRIRAAVELARKAQPQLVLLGGDYVTGHRRYAQSCAAELRRLRPPLGAIAVLGNHDHWVGPQTVREALERAGVRVLENQTAVVEVSGGRLAILGVGDTGTGHAEVAKAFRDAPAGTPAIVLSHNPDVVYLLGGRKPALVLCGHTHGGQLAWVGRFLVKSRFGQSHPAGLYHFRGDKVYVTRGVGAIMPPLRVGCRPEVTILDLQPARSTAHGTPEARPRSRATARTSGG